jgi:hypothetical protein
MPVALEFEHLFFDSTEPIEEADSDGPHFLEKFFSDAEYDAGAGGDGHAAKLAIESARIDARAKTIFQKIADAAATKTAADSGRLEKRAARTEITRYTNGTEVHAELDENNQVIRTFTKNAGQP